MAVRHSIQSHCALSAMLQTFQPYFFGDDGKSPSRTTAAHICGGITRLVFRLRPLSSENWPTTSNSPVGIVIYVDGVDL